MKIKNNTLWFIMYKFNILFIDFDLSKPSFIPGNPKIKKTSHFSINIYKKKYIYIYIYIYNMLYVI